MIRYALQCEKGHSFESWFRDNASFEQQAKRGFVACPHCGSVTVEKAIMAPHVARKDRDRLAVQQDAGQPSAPTAPAAIPMTTLTPEDKALREAIRALRQHVEANAENMGDRFADEALKIHYGESEDRQIYGSATVEDAKMLIEEGVGFQPLPMLPDDRN